MSERLEEIKIKVNNTNEPMLYIPYTDVNYLIEQAERVEELELECAGWKEAVRFEDEKLEQQNKRYREALEFYANLKNWRITHTERVNSLPSKVIADTGDKAREALESDS